MNLILIKSSELSSSQSVDLSRSDERSKHILKHLKKQSGGVVSVGVVDGCKCKAVVELYPGTQEGDANGSDSTNKGDNSIRLVLQMETFVQPQNEPEITLILAVPFPARLKALWPVISSFTHVKRIVIVKGQLSNAEFFETSALLPKIYEPLIEKGMSQGGRTRSVKVDVCLQDSTISRTLLSKLGLLGGGGAGAAVDGIARIFLDCGDETVVPPPARDIVLKHCQNTTSVDHTPKAIVAVGPERGWTDEEANTFVDQCGFETATLGSSILRVDTAVIAGLGVVSAALDECLKDNTTVRASCKRERQEDE